MHDIYLVHSEIWGPLVDAMSTVSNKVLGLPVLLAFCTPFCRIQCQKQYSITTFNSILLHQWNFLSLKAKLYTVQSNKWPQFSSSLLPSCNHWLSITIHHPFLWWVSFLNAVISIWQILYDCFKDFCRGLHMIENSWAAPHLCLLSGCAHLANDAVSFQGLGWNYLLLHCFHFTGSLNVKRHVLCHVVKWHQGETLFW